MNKKPTIGLFFTFGQSLKSWKAVGIFDREIQLYLGLLQKGYRVIFFTYGDITDFDYASEIPGIEIVPLMTQGSQSSVKMFFRSILVSLFFVDRIHRIDLIKTNQMWGSWAAVLVSLVYHKKLLVRCGYEEHKLAVFQKRAWWKRCVLWVISFIAYQRADKIVQTSSESIAYAKTLFHIKSNKFSLISNYIDIYKFYNASFNKNNRVLFVGRLHKHKNIFNLVKACHRAHVGLDLVGTGELVKDLQILINQLKADVKLLGKVDNNQLPQLYASYAVYALPSLHEGNPKTLLEAMSCGATVIASNVSGIASVIKHKENGLLMGTSEDEIYAAIIDVFSDSVLMHKMGIRAREYILQEANLSQVINKEISIYEELNIQSADNTDLISLNNVGGIKLSVIMAVYNGELFIADSIKSILNQSFKEFEFIIINDGSTDSTWNILEEYQKKDSRIRLVNQSNKGLPISLNRAIEMATGEFIARQDADDISLPNRFDKQIKYLDRHEEVFLLGTNNEIIDEYNNVIGNSGIHLAFTDCELKSILSKYNPYCHTSIMFRNNKHKIGSFYNPKFDCSQDYELWLRICRYYHIGCLKDVLVQRRETANMISVKKRRRQRWNVFKAKLQNLQYLKLNFSFFWYLFKDVLVAILPLPVKTFKKQYKVLMITGRADIGGGPEHIFRLVESLPVDIKVYIACPKDKPYWDRYIKLVGQDFVYEIPHRKLSISSIFHLMKWVTKNDIDIIHSHGKVAGLYSRPLCLLQKKIIHTYHGIHIDEYSIGFKYLYIILERILSYVTSSIICVSEGERIKSIDLKLATSSKLVTIFNGVKVPILDDHNHKQNKLNDIQILHVTRFDYVKNTSMLIDVVNILTMQFNNLKFHITILGDGLGRCDFEQEIAKHNQAQYFTLVGAVDSITPYLLQANILLSTSRWEGLPLTVLEAMAHDVPVIATNVVGNKDAIIDTKTGLLANTAFEMCQHINELNNCNSLKINLVVNAKNIIMQKFSVQQMTDLTVNLYKRG